MNSLVNRFVDRFPNESEEVKKEEEKKFKEIGEAYAVLSDSKKRNMYDSGQDLDDMGSGMGHAGKPLSRMQLCKRSTFRYFYSCITYAKISTQMCCFRHFSEAARRSCSRLEEAVDLETPVFNSHSVRRQI